METAINSVESLLERAGVYGKTTCELTKLRSLETTTVVATSLVSRLSVILMISLFVFVLTVGIALWLGELLGASYYGFFIVAAFYLLAGIVSHFFLHGWIKKPFSNLIITQALQ
jgi:hypothetical protein